MTVQEIADALVAHCKAGTEAEALETLYSEQAESIEAFPGPDGSSPITKGREGIRGKHEWWASAFEVHGGSVDGPHLHGEDRFAVIFEVDSTHRESGQRSQMKEVAIYTVEDGKIVKEEFFYAPPQG